MKSQKNVTQSRKSPRKPPALGTKAEARSWAKLEDQQVNMLAVFVSYAAGPNATPADVAELRAEVLRTLGEFGELSKVRAARLAEVSK